MIYRRRIAHAGSAVLGAVVGLSTFAAAAAAACDQPMDVYIGSSFCLATHRLCDAEAHWTECHNGGGTQVDGYVKDDKADGKCARVRAEFSNGKSLQTEKACPAGTSKPIHWNEQAQDAQVYLFIE